MAGVVQGWFNGCKQDVLSARRRMIRLNMEEKTHDIRGKVAEIELAVWRKALLGPHSPSTLAERVEAFASVAGDHVVDSSRTQFWRDAWIASVFALHRKAHLVQMLEPIKTKSGTVPPDFQIKIDDVWLRYESVEAMPKGRMRSAEFREDRQLGAKERDDHISDCDELSDILLEAISKKAKKSATYDECKGLVVLLNTCVLMDSEDRRRAFVEGTSSAGKAFDEVWIVKPPIAHQIWSCGSAVFK